MISARIVSGATWDVIIPTCIKREIACVIHVRDVYEWDASVNGTGVGIKSKRFWRKTRFPLRKSPEQDKSDGYCISLADYYQ